MMDSKNLPTRLLAPALAVVAALMGLMSGCKGESETPAVTPSTTPASSAPSPSSPSKMTASTSSDGATLYTQNCLGCHGDKASGPKRAPYLVGRHSPSAETITVVTNGKGKRMPAFKSRLSSDQITALATYVATL